MNWLKRVIFAAEVLALSANTIKASDSLWIALWRPTERCNIFRSDNDGKNWYFVASDPSWPIGEYTACALTRDQQFRFYLALWDKVIPIKLYKSLDSCKTWSYVTDINATNGGQDPYVSLVVDHVGDIKLAIWSVNTTNPYTLTSNNQGATWTDQGTVASIGYLESESPISITSDSGGVLYIFLQQGVSASNDGKCYRSINGGDSWTLRNGAVVPWGIDDPACGITTDKSGNVYAAYWRSSLAGPRVYKSLDGGTNFAKIADISSPWVGAAFNNYIDIIYASGSGAFYCAFWGDSCEDGIKRKPLIYRSTNATTWTFQDTIVDWIASEHLALSLVNISSSTPAGVEESSKLKTQNSKLEIYPNPFVQSTIIRFPAESGPTSGGEDSRLKIEDCKIQIYNMAGNLVEKTSTKSIGKNLPSGIYFVKIDGYKPTKIVKLGR